MFEKKQNAIVTLIGMPGSGKSTVGRLLAQRLQRPFIDTDTVLTDHLGLSLQEYLEQFGYLALREREEYTISNTSFPDNAIVATGGSVVYSEIAMKCLKKYGTVVFLSADIASIEIRVNNFSKRGLACAPGTSLQQLFKERVPLYSAYADIMIDVTNSSPNDVVDALINRLHINV